MPKRKVKKAELKEAFERLCAHYGVVSRGFDYNAITYPGMGPEYDPSAPTEWAMKHTKGLGWMIVCGAGGCGCKFTGASGYIRKRWEFLLFIEGLTWASVELTGKTFLQNS